jgi:aminomethyltransferase
MQQAHAEANKTPLHHWHLAHGANMVTFAGWSMPLWYPSGAAEHQIGITNAGIFDTTHAAVTIEELGIELPSSASPKTLMLACGEEQGPLGPG